ncbi:uncharacterized protein N7469_011282 [Penicillium citrinum]|uniref:Uncharacterized protein n=1 Tax=Penicillium citrinum TaxID=5077 RepID=A0A9W9ND46_PENCI|nr:uncharacterized protein N7469_011282 [Penicillium citrinum]KAJ5217657.1 hypothetical protein N7469_011282 [Penicillium citrinum]
MCAERVSWARSATSKNNFRARFCRDLCEMLIVKAEATILHDPVNSTGNTEAPKPVVRLPGQPHVLFQAKLEESAILNLIQVIKNGDLFGESSVDWAVGL